jgi:hypothetical protein
LSLTEYAQRLEALQIQLNRETFNQGAGLAYDEARMAALSADIERLARMALDSLPASAFPRPLLWDTLLNSRASDYTRLRNTIHRLRAEAVAVTVDGETVNLSNWRLFARRHLRNAEARRRAFDGLMDAAAALTPVLQQRFALSRDLYARYGVTPLDVYLEDEALSLPRLKTLVTTTARAARAPFREAAERYARELLSKPFEYYDDMYVFAGSIYEPFDPQFAAIAFDDHPNATYRRLGFDMSRISIDDEPRPGKHVSPSCWPIDVPRDIRVMYQRTSPSYDYTGYCHEMGHAVHFASIDAARPYHERYLVTDGVAEIFSTLFETLGTDPVYLSEEVGMPADVIAGIRAREQFMEWSFLVFYGANSLFKIRFWEDGLTVGAADAAYGELYADLVGQTIPGRYWQTHHVAGMYDIYAPSYLLAKVRMEELKTRLRADFGEAWWRNPKAGAYLRDVLMAPGRAVDLLMFSRLDEGPYLRSVGL